MKIVLTVAIVASACAGALVGRWTAPTPAESYIDRRAWILTEAAIRTPQGPVLVIGDSITERSGLTELCGSPVFNAGVSMAQVRDIAKMGPRLADILRPSLTFLAIGANDARLEARIDRFETRYTVLVDALPRPLVLVSMAPGEEREAYNAAIARVAQSRNLPLVEPFAYEFSYGLHPSPAGAQTWRAALENACG